MSAIPEQVRRNAERANELMAQPAEQVAAPAAEPAPQEPQDEAQAAAPAVEAPPAPAAQPQTDWEQKYRTLQGVLSAEQNRWNNDKRAMESRLQTLEASLAAKPAESAPATAPADANDIETYGPELLAMVDRQAKKIADQIVAARLDELKPQLEQTRDQVTNVANQVYKNEQERFFGELTKVVVDWQTVDTDTRWHAWLGEQDTMSGIVRQELLDNATRNLDHNRVATMFNVFKKEFNLVPAAPKAAAAPVRAQSPSPHSVGTASAPAIHEEKESVKRSEIVAHYSRGARDAAYRNSPEHKAFEQRIERATNSNQILEA